MNWISDPVRPYTVWDNITFSNTGVRQIIPLKLHDQINFLLVAEKQKTTYFLIFYNLSLYNNSGSRVTSHDVISILSIICIRLQLFCMIASRYRREYVPTDLFTYIITERSGLVRQL